MNIGVGRTLTINGMLTLNGGSITGNGTLVVNNCNSDGIMGGDKTVYVQATLVRCVNGSGTYTFPVGTANGFSPIIVKGITGTGNISVKANQGAYAGSASGLPANRLARWWQITNPGGGVTSSQVIFGYQDADIAGTESDYRAYRISGGNANLMSSEANVYTNRVAAAGVTGFSDWTLAPGVATAAPVAISGRVMNAEGRGITNAMVDVIDTSGNLRTMRTGRFGSFRFDDLTAGATYLVRVRSRRFTFAEPTRVIPLTDDLNDVDFVALPEGQKAPREISVTKRSR